MERGRIVRVCEKRFGFIRPSTPGCDDVFFHHSALADRLQGVWDDSLLEQDVEYVAEQTDKGPRAQVVKPLRD